MAVSTAPTRYEVPGVGRATEQNVLTTVAQGKHEISPQESLSPGLRERHESALPKLSLQCRNSVEETSVLKERASIRQGCEFLQAVWQLPAWDLDQRASLMPC